MVLALVTLVVAVALVAEVGETTVGADRQYYLH